MRVAHRAFSSDRGALFLRQDEGRREIAAPCLERPQIPPGLPPTRMAHAGRAPHRLVLGSWLALCLVVTAQPAGSQPGLSVPRAGMLLVAAQELSDPNFSRTVVLLCEHSEDGTLGLILNRPTDFTLADAFPDVSPLNQFTSVLFAGGPVQPGAVLALVRTSRPPAEARHLLNDIYLSSRLDAVAPLLTSPRHGETIRLFAGYAGWGPGQLIAELRAGAWVLMPADADQIFDANPATVWSDLLDRHRAPTFIREYRERDSVPAMPGDGAGVLSVARKGLP